MVALDEADSAQVASLQRTYEFLQFLGEVTGFFVPHLVDEAVPDAGSLKVEAVVHLSERRVRDQPVDGEVQFVIDRSESLEVPRLPQAFEARQ